MTLINIILMLFAILGACLADELLMRILCISIIVLTALVLGMNFADWEDECYGKYE